MCRKLSFPKTELNEISKFSTAKKSIVCAIKRHSLARAHAADKLMHKTIYRQRGRVVKTPD